MKYEEANELRSGLKFIISIMGQVFHWCSTIDSWENLKKAVSGWKENQPSKRKTGPNEKIKMGCITNK